MHLLETGWELIDFNYCDPFTALLKALVQQEGV